MKITRRSLGAGSVALLATGCSSPPALYYRLAPAPGPALAGGPPVVAVRRISIPGYLNQNGIAKPANSFQFGVYANDLWAESLGNMLQSVLVQDLAQRLSQSSILASGGAIGAPADMLVEVNILRFDPDASGRIFLNAQIAVRSSQGGAVWRNTNFAQTASPAGPAVADIVAAMSLLWGQAADQTAGLLAQAWREAAPS